MTIALGTISLVLAIALCYFGLRRWRRGNGADSLDRSSSFRPRIGFTRLDGMESLSLLLPNETRTHVWAEEIEIFLTELVANDQTAEPTFRGTQKIRQMIPPRRSFADQPCGSDLQSGRGSAAQTFKHSLLDCAVSDRRKVV